MSGEIIHADIFFFVTTMVVMVLGIGALIALVYMIKILALVKSVATTVKSESSLIAEDINELRERMRYGGSNLGAVARFFFNIFQHYKK